MSPSRLGSVLAAAAFLAAAACGGTAAPTEPVLVVLPATAALDGMVLSDGTFDATGGPPVTGDLDGVTDGLGCRQFFSFDLSGLPDGSTIIEAYVGINVTGQSGAPFQSHGSVRLEHVVYGDTLDGSDYDVPALRDHGGLSVATADDDILSGLGANVTSAVQADLAASRPRSQFRLRFSSFDSNGDGVSNYTLWVDAERSANGVGLPASLQIVYLPPAP
jgi:hypothetical protein